MFVRVASPEEWRAREEESRESGGMETSGGVFAGRRGIARERAEEEKKRWWCVSLWRESRPIADCVSVCRESVWYLGERRVCRGRESSGTPHNERNRTEREASTDRQWTRVWFVGQREERRGRVWSASDSAARECQVGISSCGVVAASTAEQQRECVEREVMGI